MYKFIIVLLLWLGLPLLLVIPLLILSKPGHLECKEIKYLCMDVFTYTQTDCIEKSCVFVEDKNESRN